MQGNFSRSIFVPSSAQILGAISAGKVASTVCTLHSENSPMDCIQANKLQNLTEVGLLYAEIKLKR